MQKTLVDAGFFIGLLNRADKHHDAAVKFLRGAHHGELLTTWPCLTESAYFLNTVEKVALLEFVALGHIAVLEIDAGGLAVMREAINTYGDKMDVADASLVWAAGKTGVSNIFTVDVKDFSTYRFAGKNRFNIINS